MSRLRARPVAQALFLATAVAAAIVLASCDEQGQLGNPQSTAVARPRGEIVFARYCNSCHPRGAAGAGPSLIQSTLGAGEFHSFVRTGKNRMPAFNAGLISDEDLDHMYQYIQGLKK